MTKDGIHVKNYNDVPLMVDGFPVDGKNDPLITRMFNPLFGPDMDWGELKRQEDAAAERRRQINRITGEMGLQDDARRIVEFLAESKFGDCLDFYIRPNVKMDENKDGPYTIECHGSFWHIKTKGTFWDFDIAFDCAELRDGDIIFMRKGTAFERSLKDIAGHSNWWISGTKVTHWFMEWFPVEVRRFDKDERWKDIPNKCNWCGRPRFDPAECMYRDECRDNNLYFFRDSCRMPGDDEDEYVSETDIDCVGLAYGGDLAFKIEKDTGILKWDSNGGEYAGALTPKGEDQILLAIQRAREIRERNKTSAMKTKEESE